MTMLTARGGDMMNMQNFMLTSAFMAIASSLLLLIYALSKHTEEEARSLIYLAGSTFMYSYGFTAELLSSSMDAAMLAVRIQYLALPLIVPFSLLFVRDVYHLPRFTRLQTCMLFVIPVTSQMSMYMYPHTNIFYENATYVVDGVIATVRVEPGWMYQIYSLFNYILFAVIIALSIMRLIQKWNNHSARNQGILILIAYTIPMIVSLFYIFSTGPIRYDYTPFAHSITLMLLLYALRYQNLLSVAPIARTYVIETMKDALIVCDLEFSFIDANKTAKKLFPEIKQLFPGDPFKVGAQLSRLDMIHVEMGNSIRIFKISKTKIAQKGAVKGLCFVLNDVTENQTLFQRLNFQANYDPLMNIYNRRRLLEIMEARLTEEGAQNFDYAVLMLDLDHFKRINDTYGHLAGDAVLNQVAACIKNSIRKNDVVGRYGGEEIVVFLNEVQREQAHAIAEKLRVEIESLEIQFQGQLIPVTVSLGVAHSLSGKPHNLEAMLGRADDAMYVAKREGRNRVVMEKNLYHY